MDQRKFDDILEKLKNEYSSISITEYKELVDFIQYRYNGYDPILSSLSAKEILRNYDYLLRSVSESIKDMTAWGSQSKHYILSNLFKSSYGLTSENRREIFKEKNLKLYQDNVGFGRQTGFAKFLFFIEDEFAYLLIAKEYGHNSITNRIEELVSIIESEFLEDIGFSIIENNVQIWYMEDSNFFQQVYLEPGLTRPTWRNLEENEKLWFQDVWLRWEKESDNNQPEAVFFEKGRQFDAYITIKSILLSARKEILIVDNYIDFSLLLILTEVNSSVSIKLITSKLNNDMPVALEKYKAQHRNFEWCQVKDFHDRYLFVDNQCYLLGSSIKDFANKATTLLEIKERHVIKSIREYAMNKFRDGLDRRQKDSQHNNE